MRLTTSSSGNNYIPISARPRTRWFYVLVITGAFLVTFALDRWTGNAPVEHLYYLPILLAAYSFGNRGGLAAALVAVCCYHVANRSSLHEYTKSDGVQIGVFLAVGLVTARLVRDRQTLRVLATTDDLTGLHNLRSFESRLAAFVRASRESDTPLSVLSLDVDHLKALNDRHGHLAGAEVVRSIGHILGKHLPPDAVACRYGGDEFAVALPAATRPRRNRSRRTCARLLTPRSWF